MKIYFTYIGLCLLAIEAAGSAASVAYLDHQHMDLRLQYRPAAEGTNQLDLVLGYDTGAESLRATNDQVYIVAGAAAQLTIPSNPNFAFLGPAGEPIWVLPQSQNVALPYLGVSAEDLPVDVFDGPGRLELRNVCGPGNFFVWQNSGAGQPPIVKMIFTNGAVNPNFNHTAPILGSHEHFNWGFSTSGLYRVTFRCFGQRLGESTNLIGRDVTWAFQILPLRPYEQWVATNWPPATPTNIVGPNQDPDADGVLNVMEYALGLDPHLPSPTGHPVFSLVTDGGQTFGALTYTRVKWAADLTYSPIASGTLDFSSAAPLTELFNVTDHGETETVTYRDGVPIHGTAARFLQLQLALEP